MEEIDALQKERNGFFNDRFQCNVHELYSNRAEVYDKSKWHSDLADRLVELLIPRLIKHRSPRESMIRVLDVGTGTGMVSFSLVASLGEELAEVIGLDISAKMLEVASKKAELANLKILKFMEGDFNRLTDLFPPKFFDAIVCCAAITFVIDPEATFRDWSVVLKDGGILAYQHVSESSYPEFKLIQDALTERGYFYPNLNAILGTADRSRAVLLKAGFKEVEVLVEQGWGHWRRTNSDVWIHTVMYPQEVPQPIVTAVQEEVNKQLQDRVQPEGIHTEVESLFVFATKSFS
eukprot:CAMPEP_0184335302 /NCGR_PEP_ID=MMETSP1089-20130417/3888_1 /TAXON_ID=38269 ORGANISM="Gloeochaete wittrockiana, Strain SAG46.84" /NCGR_SAMPLE_ID=MMETSP1089 /ASSEMBLY_ACC=CAM_ASM_000445 /LENGTH=291 /DNA_ID=CAMNT_0026659893 /DNA_START=65 /DNA_END=940 /DNA_ORIENTATION=+